MLTEKDKRFYESWANNGPINRFFKFAAKNVYLGRAIRNIFDIHFVNPERIVSGGAIYTPHHVCALEFPLVLELYERGQTPHSLLHEKTFGSFTGSQLLFSLMEQVPFDPGKKRDKIEEIRRGHFWSIDQLRGYLEKQEALVVHADGAKFVHRRNEEDYLVPIENRPFSTIPGELSQLTGKPIVPVSQFIPKEHAIELATYKPGKTIDYLKRVGKIPFYIYLSEPMFITKDRNPEEIKNMVKRAQTAGLRELERICQ